MSIEIDLAGRGALVTGSGAGIGREIARWLARAGAPVAALVVATPLRRMTEPDELARLVVFLASDLARCFTGQLFLADAGAFLSRTRPESKG